MESEKVKQIKALIMELKSYEDVSAVNQFAYELSKTKRAIAATNIRAHLRMGDKVRFKGNRRDPSFLGTIMDVKLKKAIVRDDGTGKQWQCHLTSLEKI